jgi:hypothetical protein
MLSGFAIAVAIGVLGETVAARGRLWLYGRPLYRVLNVLGVFGVVMGGLATLGPGLGAAGLFAAGVAIGAAWEVTNLAWLGWWTFPADGPLGAHGPRTAAVAAAVAWGTVPVAVAWLAAAAR